MDIALEVQYAVNTVTPRGVGNYVAQLVKRLTRRKKYRYGLTFFTHGHEDINRRMMAKKLFPDEELFECADLDYRDYLRRDEVFANRSYDEYVGASANLYHFMNIIGVPTAVHGEIVVTVHDLNWLFFDEACSPIIHHLAQIGWNRVKKLHPRLIAVSENTKREIMSDSDYSANEIDVIYPGFDATVCFPDADTAKLAQYGVGNEYIFFVGVFERKKNITTIIRAFNELADNHPALQLVLAGHPTWDNADDIYAAIERSPYRNRIVLTGYVDDDVKRALFANARLLMFPSLCEGFGVPIVEAFACGCPVVAADIPTFREVAGDAALFASPRNVAALAKAAADIIDDSDLRRDLIERGFSRVENFSWDKTAQQTESVYAKILGY